MSHRLVLCLLFILVVVNQLTVVSCGLYTVTDEAWFEVLVKDVDGEGNSYRGRFTIALFGETAQITVMNFAALVKGITRRNRRIKSLVANLGYKNSPIHRVVPDLLIQMGDITKGDGTGGTSIYGERFNDEDFILTHRSPGWVAMANHGKNTNASQFFILLTKARWLDGKHVVFGKVIRGFDTISTIGEVATDPSNGVPLTRVWIMDCGLNPLENKYDLTESQLDSTEDL